MKITQRALDGLSAPTKDQKFLWDDSLRGFGVRISAGGAAAFVVQYRQPNGTTTRKTVGRVGVMPLAAAKDEARQHLFAASQGDDIETAREKARKLSLSDLWARYEADGFPKPRAGYKAPATVRTDRDRWALHIKPRLGGRLIDRLDDAEIEKLRTDIRRTGSEGQGERCVALVKALLSYARRLKLTSNVAGMSITVQPSRKVSNPLGMTDRKRLRTALEAMRTEGTSLFAAAAIETALLTGMRLGEVLGLKWDWVYLDQRAIELPTAKGDQRRGRAIVLSQDAVTLLRSLPTVHGNPHVFPGRRTGEPLTNINKPWAEAKARAGIRRGVRFHDLRHSFGTAAAAAGVGQHALKVLMGHKDAATTQRYVSLSDHTLRAELDKVAI